MDYAFSFLKPATDSVIFMLHSGVPASAARLIPGLLIFPFIFLSVSFLNLLQALDDPPRIRMAYHQRGWIF